MRGLNELPNMTEIAIVGGGPSGAMCGEQLARGGHSVQIFDEHLAWEKPCGGGLTHKAVECFPFLLDNPYPKKLVSSIELISSNEQSVMLDMSHPIVIYSRTVLNGMLLNRAADAGCKVQRSHVIGVDTTTEKPRYCVDGEWRTADFLVLAAGARNRLLPETRPLERDELEMTQGYFVPQTCDAITVKFLPHFEGYIWSFPRCDHLSVGICGSMSSHTSTELRSHLQSFVHKKNIEEPSKIDAVRREEIRSARRFPVRPQKFRGGGALPKLRPRSQPLGAFGVPRGVVKQAGVCRVTEGAQHPRHVL